MEPVQPHAPVSRQAWPLLELLQSPPPGPLQPQLLLLHAEPAGSFVQSAHALPEAPHVFVAPLPAHWPLLQQKPLPQVPSPLLPHAFVQLPPEHVGVWPEQGAHMLPLFPQPPLARPSVQLLPSQQPPLHVRPPAHDVAHTCDELQACPVGQSFWPLQPQTPDTHLLPIVDAVQSGSFLQPQLVPMQLVPWLEDVQLTHCPGLPQLAGVPLHAPESEGGGGESTTCPSVGPSAWASPPVVPVSMAESDPVVPSTPEEPLSSLPVAIESPALPSLAESLRPALLRPHAAASTPSAHESRSPGTAFLGCTRHRMKHPVALVDEDTRALARMTQNEPDQPAP